jgi:hemerythrin-like metal-binding protein
MFRGNAGWRSEVEFGRIILEIVDLSGSALSIDALLGRLIGILKTIPMLHLKSQVAIFLFNSDRNLVPIAQYGMISPDRAKDYCRAMQSLKTRKMDGIIQPCLHDMSSAHTNSAKYSPAYCLPLQDHTRHMGYVALFPEEDELAQDWELLATLAKALSGLVGRCILDEIAKVREWELEEARIDTLLRLGTASEHRHQETGWHVIRMANYAVVVAKHFGLPKDECELLYITAPMHDVGKICIPDAILLKPGRLLAEELAVMRRHTEIGETILVGEDDITTAARKIAGCHHERWDGEGYPHGLRGEEIPIFARISAIADVFDALTTPRTYKPAWSIKDTLDWIYAQSGSQFDPNVVEAFRRAIPEILRIRELYRDEIIVPKQVLTLAPSQPKENCWVKWDDSLTVGIDVIDEHHRHIFDLVNDFHDVVAERRGAREAARFLNELDRYTNVHFLAEERMMEHFGYPETLQQKQLHQYFRDRLSSFRQELHVNPLTAQHDILDYFSQWLQVHIRDEAKALKVLIN